MKITKQDLAIEVCKDQFVESFRSSVAQAGGCPSVVLSQNSMLMHDLASALATNGVRFTYDSKKTIRAVTDSELFHKLLEVVNNEQ